MKNTRMKYKYETIWIVFANFTSQEGLIFNDLIEAGHEAKEKYIGAWSYLIIKTNNIKEVCELADNGLAEKGFELKKISTIENFSYLLDYNEANRKMKDEVKWLLKTPYVFKIFDKIFPYIK